jgi:hypothetical protein
VAAHAECEGSPPPSTACSANLRGRRDETTPHHSLCTGTGLTGPRRCYSEATCSNLLAWACLPLLSDAQHFNTRRHVLLLTCVCCANFRVDFFGLCVILRRMSSITSGVRTAGALCFGALCTDPVARHFLTNVCMALFAGMPLPGNLFPKIPRVSQIEPVLTYASTIATLSSIEYVILHNAGYRCSLNATFDSTVLSLNAIYWRQRFEWHSKRSKYHNDTCKREAGYFSCATLYKAT